MTTLKRQMAAYFRERATRLRYAENAGACPVDRALAHTMGFPYALYSQGGIAFPYLSPLDREPHPTLMRIRYLGELPRDDDGKPIRYTQPKGSGVEAFFDANIDWIEVMRDSSIRIAITEGEVKALYMNQHREALGNIATIALGGVWNFRDKESGDLTAWLRMIRASRSERGGKFIIAFDSDMAESPDIQAAAAKLAELLNIEVRGVAWK